MSRRLAAVPDQPQRAVLYLRVSALMGRAGEDFHSPDLQLEAMRRHVAAHGLREVGVVDDIDVSGTTFTREGLDQIRAMVEAGRVDVVAVYDLSRLGRDLAESLTFIKWLRGKGVAIVSTQERIDDTPEGQYMLGQFLGMAELYARQLGRRWAAVLARRAREGRYHSPPIGYRREPKQDMVIDPVIGPAVTQAFGDYAAGVSIFAITRDVAAARGQRTYAQVVKAMFRNPAYLGKVPVWGGGGRTGQPVELHDGRHEPLVDEETWDLVQERMRRDSRTPARSLRPTHPFTRLVMCGLCEGAAQSWIGMVRTRDGVRRVPRLRCAHSQIQGEGKCPGFGQPRQSDVTAVVLERVAEHVQLLRSDSVAVAEAHARKARSGADLARVEAELKRVRSEMTKLTKGWAAGRVPDHAYDENLAELRAAERALEDQRVAAKPSASASPAEAANLAEELLALWPDQTVEERNRALKAVVKRVVFVRRAAHKQEPVSHRIRVDFL